MRDSTGKVSQLKIRNSWGAAEMQGYLHMQKDYFEAYALQATVFRSQERQVTIPEQNAPVDLLSDMNLSLMSASWLR